MHSCAMFKRSEYISEMIIPQLMVKYASKASKEQHL